MEKYVFHEMVDLQYSGIITILDYEIRVKEYLSDIKFPPKVDGKKIVVDMALVSGINKYRFVEFDMDDTGFLMLNSNKYIDASEELEKEADGYLRECRDAVINSMLTGSQIIKILEE